MYQTRLAPAAEAYRSVDLTSRIESASPHGLVTILYEELLGALGVVRAAVRAGTSASRADGLPRALTILQALENGLDHDKGGAVAGTLAQVYRGIRAQVSKAAGAGDLPALDEARRMVADLALAWGQIGK
ncbi:flagellar export chaperone FliS [Sphingomonas jatrophae]|uniref:Flagellar protein FliS n=1 Tax=Sphingomonas jatrophae TaxID=1166337 RepID=A0A1I6M0K6_9SPHN|nr:flagellar export chaperone FliS [Sphingomonas jatrophae]SFS09256.1 flagellar protein FliS [Sphingomonas jatrophae]